MHSNLEKASLSSCIIETYYIKLRELSFNNQENTKEYTDIIDKLKRLILNEESIYQALSDDEITTTIAYFKTNGIKNVTEARIYSKLSQLYRKRNNLTVTTELGNIIATKLMIDVLKMLTNKISKLSTSSLLEEEIEIVFAYNNIYKYNHLTMNDYIEKLAIEYKFDIISMPTTEFDDIDRAFNTSIVKKSSELFLSYIYDAIDELLKIKTDDKYQMIYLTLLEMSRIEIMLPRLNKECLIKLSSYLSSLNIQENSSAIKKIRRLVDKRKEEFEI